MVDCCSVAQNVWPYSMRMAMKVNSDLSKYSELCNVCIKGSAKFFFTCWGSSRGPLACIVNTESE